MLAALLRLAARLPLPVLHLLGKTAGRLVYAFPGRYRRRREHCKYLAHENPRILEENCKNRLICCPATSCPPYNLSVHECPDK